MEGDIYRKDEKSYIIGMISLVICLVSLVFSLYILPFLIWNLAYEIPEFVIQFIHYLQDARNFSFSMSRFLVWFVFFGISLITGLITYLISKRFDKEIVEKEDQENAEVLESKEQIQETKRLQRRESFGIGFKILALIFACLVVFFIIHSLLE